MSRETILVVEDNPANRKLINIVLSSSGYDVHTGVDANDALKSIKTTRPQLILMDVQLPGMDGLELTRRLKADPNTRDILIIAVTAYAMKGDDEKARPAGCDGYVTKPIDTKGLPKLVASYLAGRAPSPGS